MKRTYATLDGIRGIAALLIVVRHTSAFFGGFQPQETFLAVDLFFGLSGFVLGHSYEARLNDGLSPGGFMTIRLNRFVPLYVLGLALGAVAATVAILSGGADLDWTSVGVSFALGLFFLPSPMFGATGAKLFPLNDPSWSLFMELFANAAMAVFWRRLSNRVLVGICATSAALLAISALKLGTADLGFRWVGLGFGVYRVGYSFFAGLLVYRLRDRIGLAIHPVIAFLLVAFALVRSVGDAGRAIYELAWIFVGFPLLIAAASAREPVIGARICRFLGVTSYGVYVLHYPLQRLVTFATRWATGHDVSDFAPWAGFAFVAGLLALCWALDRYYDTPLRRRLSAWVAGLPPAPAELPRRAPAT